jgi:hypothetical protein
MYPLRLVHYGSRYLKFSPGLRFAYDLVAKSRNIQVTFSAFTTYQYRPSRTTMDATRLENATTSYNSITAVSGFAVGSARGHFRPIRCQRRRKDHYNPDKHGFTGRPWRYWTGHFTDAIPCLHG